MDVDEFARQHPPRGKRSRLEPYRADILKLRQSHYTYAQICEWLALNQVRVSTEGLRRFIKQREAATSPPAQTPGGTIGQPDDAHRKRERPIIDLDQYAYPDEEP